MVSKRILAADGDRRRNTSWFIDMYSLASLRSSLLSLAVRLLAVCIAVRHIRVKLVFIEWRFKGHTSHPSMWTSRGHTSHLSFVAF